MKKSKFTKLAALTLVATLSVSTPAAGAIASKIVDEMIPIVYYKRTYSERTSAVITSMVVASKWDTWYYSDKSHKNYLGYTFDKVYLDGYKE